MRVKVGTCGIGMPKAKYAELFDVAEAQQTFYEPPQIKTLEKWRTEVPDDFEFTVKAWQLITHTSRSPTYRRLKRALTDEERRLTGNFQQSETVEIGWVRTRDSAIALKAQKILFQCPASFTPSIENIDNLTHFFSFKDRAKDTRTFTFLFEPRGDEWTDELITQLCKDLDLVHVVDPFVRRTVTPQRTYYRLHGRNGYSYIYEDSELKDLAELVASQPGAYVMFNNTKMKQDALRFKEILMASQ